MITKDEVREVQATRKIPSQVWQFFTTIPEEEARKLLPRIKRFRLGDFINEKMIPHWVVEEAICDEYWMLPEIPRGIQDAFTDAFGYPARISDLDRELRLGGGI